MIMLLILQDILVCRRAWESDDMWSIDITDASWTDYQGGIMSELIRTETEAGTQLTVMAYGSTEYVLRFRAYFYTENQTLISNQGEQGGNYITVPAGTHYISTELYSVTRDQLFSAIMYADLEYDFPMHQDLSVESSYSVAESNGEDRRETYSLITEQASVAEYSYELTKAGDLWTVTEYVTQ